MSVHPSRKHLVRRRHVMWFVADVLKVSGAVIVLCASLWVAWFVFDRLVWGV